MPVDLPDEYDNTVEPKYRYRALIVLALALVPWGMITAAILAYAGILSW